MVEPITMTLIALAGGALAGTGSSFLKDLAGKAGRDATRRELRELLNLRYGVGQSFLEPVEYQRDIGTLARLAQQMPYGGAAQRAVGGDLARASLGDRLAAQESSSGALAAMGLAGTGLQDRLLSEAERARGLLASQARLQADVYGAQMNVQGLEAARQAYSQALTDRYGTLATVLSAGV